MTGGKVRAAVDVGTNSVRLIVIDPDGRTLAREMEITRLGHGVDRRGHLDDAALERTLEVIARYREAWESHGAAAVRIAATSAIRDAQDRDRFFTGVREITGRQAHVLSGDEEAATTFTGVTSRLDLPGPLTVIDVGGGSTELIVGDEDGRCDAAVSLQLGCVRLAERHLANDPPTDAELAAGRDEAADALRRGASELRERGRDPRDAASLVGVAGTVTTLVALHLGLERYDATAIHGARLPAEEVRRLTAELAGMTSAERAELGPMAPGREDVIVAGAVVLDAALDVLEADAVTASEADILDGLALEAGRSE